VIGAKATMTSKKKHICEKCGKPYKNRHSLLTHRYTCVLKKTFKCKHCDKTFPTRQNRWRHEQVHNEQIYTCKICKKPFSSKYGMNDHMTHVHEYFEYENRMINLYTLYKLKEHNRYVPVTRDGVLLKTYKKYIAYMRKKASVKICKYCGKRCYRTRLLHAHILSAHGISVNEPREDDNTKVIDKPQVVVQRVDNNECTECGDVIYDVKRFYSKRHKSRPICYNCKLKENKKTT